MSFDAFHFLRPEWLWALLPAAVLGWLLIRNRQSGGADGWAKLVDHHLLQHLAINGSAARRSRFLPIAGFLATFATILGLAGPTWQESDVPSFEGGEPVVAVLSLAQSMNADDLTPTRLKRSIHKLRDILDRTKGDERGLVIYSDTPFVAAPLTSDAQVIDQMLPELSTTLMPVLGNRLNLAISEARDLLQRAGAARGQIVVIADDAGDDPGASIAAARDANRAGYTVSVLGAGTEEGATLQTADGRAITTRDGQSFMTKLSKDELEEIGSAGGGTFSMITAGGADLDRILPETANANVAAGEKQDFQADAWIDMGYWLLLLPAFIAPFAFRRGVIFSLALMASFGALQPGAVQAGTWDDLWATADQQGRDAFEQENFGEAAALFETPDWKATAAYREGDFATAANEFSGSDYNLGNALAKSGDFEAALAAYDQALAANPDDEDAQFNRDLIADLLEQQQEQEQQNQEQSQDQQGGEQSQDQQGGEQSQDQQGGEQSQDQQGGEQSQDQQGGEQSQGHQGGEQSQDQQGGEQSQDQQGGEQSQDHQGGEQSQEQTAADETPNREAGGQEDPQGEDAKGLTERLSDFLSGEPEDTPEEMVEGSQPGAQILDQAVEQQLRRVPDDPSGLLRARIRQHYARARAGN